MKSMTAMEVRVMKLLKRSNVQPKGNVILAATADVEKGGGIQNLLFSSHVMFHYFNFLNKR